MFKEIMLIHQGHSYGGGGGGHPPQILGAPPKKKIMHMFLLPCKWPFALLTPSSSPSTKVQIQQAMQGFCNKFKVEK